MIKRIPGTWQRERVRCIARASKNAIAHAVEVALGKFAGASANELPAILDTFSPREALDLSRCPFTSPPSRFDLEDRPSKYDVALSNCVIE